MRASLFLLIFVVIGMTVSCSRRDPAPTPATNSPVVFAQDLSSSMGEYERIGMPGIAKPWTPADYIQAARVVQQISQKDSRELPRVESAKSAALFKRICANENLEVLRDAAIPPDQRFQAAGGFVSGAKSIMVVYLDASRKGQVFDLELVELMGFLLRLSREARGVADQWMASSAAPAALGAARNVRVGLGMSVRGAADSLMETNVYRAPARLQLTKILHEIIPTVFQDFQPELRGQILDRLRALRQSEASADLKNELDELITSLEKIP